MLIEQSLSKKLKTGSIINLAQFSHEEIDDALMGLRTGNAGNHLIIAIGAEKGPLMLRVLYKL